MIRDFLFANPKKYLFYGNSIKSRKKKSKIKSKENTVKRFLDKLQSFVHHKFGIAVKWSTMKIRSLFRLKDKNPHPTCKIHEGTCSCSSNYIGDTKGNVETLWN